MADHDHTPTTRSAPNPTRSATLADFDEALSQAHLIASIISKMAAADIGGQFDVDASIYDWLADELSARLERIEVAGQTLRVRGC